SPMFPAGSFSSLSQAESENARSRISLGLHWAFTQPLELRRQAGGRIPLQTRGPEGRELSGKRQTIPGLNTSHSMSWRALGLGLARCEPPPRLRPPSAHVDALQTAKPSTRRYSSCRVQPEQLRRVPAGTRPCPWN